MSLSKTESSTSRREFLQAGIAAAGSTLISPLLSAAETKKDTKRPNLIFIYHEGQRWDALSATGNSILRTPNQDRIAREGVMFNRSFCTNALCAPSRMTAVTGMYSSATGGTTNRTDQPLPREIPLFTDLLHEAGYDVALCGKAHAANGFRERYWDYYLGYNAAVTNYYRPRLFEGRNGVMGQEATYEGYADDLFTDRALSWLQEKRDRPFCLLLWFQAPHAPFFRARADLNLYDGLTIPVPSTFDDDLKGYPGKPRVFANAVNKIGTWDDVASVRSLEGLAKDYYAGLAAVDRNIGRVLDFLEHSGQLDDTAILQSSDHGFFMGEWRMFDKRFMHEPSIRVPTLLRYPKQLAAGTKVNEMVLNVDIAPTFLELAGVEIPKHMQGRSLVELAKGSASNWRKDWYYEYFENAYKVPKQRGIRTERYKLIDYYESNPHEHELYDLESDPGELRNLSEDPRYNDLRNSLMKRMGELRKEAEGESAS